MKRITNENPFLCGREVLDEAMLNRKVSIQTANRYLRNFVVLGRVAKRVNYHSVKLMSKRCQFCISVKQLDFSWWQKVAITDKVRIEMESRRRFLVHVIKYQAPYY